jgi:anti-sigma factor RsiW
LNCQEIQKLMTAFENNELDLLKTLEIENHLQDCPVCADEYKRDQALRLSIRKNSDVLYFKPPLHLSKQIQSSLKKNIGDKAPFQIKKWHWLGLAASLSMAVVLIWGLIQISSFSSNQFLIDEVVSSHIRSLMGNHLTDVASSDQHNVKPWFNGRLDFSPMVRDLAEQGFSLVGGRLDYLNKRPVAVLIYQHRQHYINLFIWPSPQDKEIPVEGLTRRGYNLFYWSQSGTIFWAISDLNRQELEDFVNLLKRQTA